MLPSSIVVDTPLVNGRIDFTNRGSTLFVVLDGINDVEFMRRISRVLATADGSMPDLEKLENDGRLVFIPRGGSDNKIWSHRLASLHAPEFHLYDRDCPPLSELHESAAAEINQRERAVAVVMRKRSLENYLHPTAIEKVSGVVMTFSDREDVPGKVWDGLYARAPTGPGKRSRRHRRRSINRIKQWLNREAVDAMTPALVAQQDPAGEIRNWLRTIQQLAHQS